MPKGLTYIPAGTKKAKQLSQAKGSRPITETSFRSMTPQQIEQMKWNESVEANKKLNKKQGRQY